MSRQMYFVIASLLSVVILVLIHGTNASLVTCPSTVNGNVLVPHQFECSSFFLCDRSSSKPSFLLRCPIGYYFNNVGQSSACAEVAEVNCVPGLEVSPVEYRRSSAPLPPIDSPDNYRNYTMYLPHPRNCSQFYKYEGWNDPKLYECPENHRFDTVLEICDLAEEVNCRSRECQDIPKPHCPPSNESFITLPHPTNCTDYYVCNWGNPILNHCPEDLYFNPALGVCDWPSNVECNRCPPSINGNELLDESIVVTTQ